MMNKQIVVSWNKIEPDDAASERMLAAILERNRAVQKGETASGLMRRSGKYSRRSAAIALAACLILVLGITAFAVNKWTGYADTEGLSHAEIESLLRQYAPRITRQLIEPDGTVHYLDDQNNEVMVLNAKEAAKYDAEIRQAQEQAVRESTDLIDVDSLGFVPKGITVVPVSDDGTFHGFALGNGYMVLLCTEEGKPFPLRAGATVTIHLEANDTCGMAFGVTLDGEEIDRAYAKAQEHLFSYTVPSDGEYCFALMYAGSDASSFQNCVLTIRG